MVGTEILEQSSSQTEREPAFGIAGWSYPDWNGIVYPKGVRDRLEYVAGFVDCVEINSSFYRLPSKQTAASWVERTAAKEPFFFAAKLPSEITHRGLLSAEVAAGARRAFLPLAEAGKLKHLLAQFRYDFKDSVESRSLLTRICSAFAPISNIVFELRHISWQADEALDWLDSLVASVANLDYPMADDSFSLRECRVGRHRYLRLHGRNRAAWFDAEAGRDRTYDYFYSAEELKGIVERIGSIAEGATSLTVIANNHFQGKELANVLQLKAMITGKKLAVPEGLLARYGELRQIAERPSFGLFDADPYA